MSNLRFKVDCPSCSVGIIVRSSASVGKKIECPKCKFRFVCPAPPSDDDDQDEDDVPLSKAKKGEGNAATKKGEGSSSKKGKGSKGNKGEKAKAGKSKVLIGVIIGVLALVALGVGAWFMMSDDSTPSPKTPPVAKAPAADPNKPDPNKPDPNKPDPNKPDPNKPDPNKPDPNKPKNPRVQDGQRDITNLLPGDTNSLWYLRFDELGRTSLLPSFFDQPMRELFRASMTFESSDIDRLIISQSGQESLPFAVIRTRTAVDEAKLIERMNPNKMPVRNVKGRDYYQIQSNPFLKAFTLVFNDEVFQSSTVGGATAAKKPVGAEKPLALCIYDSRTLIIADKTVMGTFLEELKEDGFPPYKSELLKESPATPPPGTTPPMGMQPGTMPPMGMTPGTPPPAFRKNPNSNPTFRTIEPRLKKAINELDDESKETPAFINVQLIDQRQVNEQDFRGSSPEIGPLVLQLFKRFRVMGVSLTRFAKERIAATAYLEFASNDDARKSAIELIQPALVLLSQVYPQAAGNMLEIKSQLQANDPGTTLTGPMTGPGNPNPGVPATADNTSKIDLRVVDTVLLLDANLLWREDKWNGQVSPAVYRIMGQFKAKIAVHSGDTNWFSLASTFPRLAKERDQFPRGTLERDPQAERFGLPYPPEQRVSFMAELLPYVGKNNVRTTIQDQKFAWYARENLPAAETWIPEFLVPGYDPSAWRANHHLAEGHSLGATNYVGVAGLGRDAARFDPNNPDHKKRVGMVGYDWSTKPADVTDGLSNTIYMMQVPPGHQRPWIAGGGATIVGIDDTGEPFKEFASPGPTGRGTHVLMADGSVRWVKEGVDPKVFRAMSTRAGGETLTDLDKLAPLQKPVTAELAGMPSAPLVPPAPPPTAPKE